jgi:SAM-dependent methyltransferase
MIKGTIMQKIKHYIKKRLGIVTLQQEIASLRQEIYSLYPCMQKNLNKKFTIEKLQKFNSMAFSVEPYQIQALSKMALEYDFTGKRVLEIGGSNLPREITFGCLEASKWVCVDYLPAHFDYAKSKIHYLRETVVKLATNIDIGKEDYIIYDGKVEDIPASFFNYFDVVISLCAFEHITRLEGVLTVIKKCLVSRGMLFASFGPIWSCFCGHHCWVTKDLNFNTLKNLPHFAHLLMSPDELKDHLTKFYPYTIVEQAIDQIYMSNRVNRLFYEDYIELFNRAGFSSHDVSSQYDVDETPDILEKLHKLYPKYSNFTTYTVYICAQK